MEIITPIGELKTHCYQLLEEMQKTNDHLLITKRGTPIARIIPINRNIKISIFGLMKGKAKIIDNILELSDIKWNAEHE
ncbi:antitoxin [Rickettsiales bacterium Ac37b]|nr:antitoxin [Rickettsiales bacterium Ac37b]